MNATRYFTGLLITAAMIAVFPLTMRGHNGQQKSIYHDEDENSLVQHQNLNRGAAGLHERVRVFRITAYCAGECCCDQYGRIPVSSGRRRTASGYTLGEQDYGRICAAPAEYPFGTRFIINDEQFVCEDRGGSIKSEGEKVGGKRLRYPRLDILMKDHKEALNFGVQYLEVTILTGENHDSRK